MDTNATLTTESLEALLAEHRDEIVAMDEDEETVELADGIIVRLRLLPDDTNLLDEAGEGMWCGKLAWPPRRGNDYHVRGERPAGFDGNAELLGLHIGHTQAYDRLWWQPPSDVPRTDPHFAALRQNVIDVLEDGYDVVVLEVCAGTDAYGHPIVVAHDSIGAVHARGDGVLEDTIPDLIDNLEVMVATAAA